MESNNVYNFLDLNNKLNPRTKLSNNAYQKYSKLLNNLLGISTRSDYAVFTKINNYNFDLIDLIRPEDVNNIFIKTKFKIKLNKKIKIVDAKNNEKEIVDNSLFLTKWKRYIKSVNESFDQTNSWPLYIGTYFLKVNSGQKVIYAPLVLRQIEIAIIDNDVYIINRSESVELNEKLIFMLEEYTGLIVPPLKNDIDNMTFNDVINELDKYFANSIDFVQMDILNKFSRLRTVDITNNRISKANGTVILFAHPQGGVLRNVVLDLIEQDKIKDLIHIDFETTMFGQGKSMNDVIEQPKSIARICQTDLSQEKAIISSLEKSTIIIGPPGTGKSQTIANILANIMLNNKRALFISQKRVALEVVLERMNNLQYFTLQLVENKKATSKDEKSWFYSYMKSFLNLCSASQMINNQYPNLNSLVSKEIKDYWNSKESLNVSKNDIDMFSYLKQNQIKIDDHLFKEIKSVYDQLNQINKKDQIDYLIKSNLKEYKQFLTELNIQPIKKILWKKIYSDETKIFYDSNVKLLNVIEQYKINKNIMDIIDQYQTTDNLVKIQNVYYKFLKPFPDVNKFVSNEVDIIKQIGPKTNSILNSFYNQDKSWARKFLGRIERSFTQPSKFINLFKNELKQLFNVYVSTPEALASFIDFKKDRFDYLIFDEASQIFLEKAIPYISIADKVIVAGDDQQMQPSNWFGFRTDVDEDEKDEENIDSLLTWSIENGIPKEMLELNYRSKYANLTTFSSKQFYDSNLKTIDSNIANKQPSIEVYNVDGRWENESNLTEAQKVISLLKQNMNSYHKIIILTLNKKQCDFINDLLSNYESDIYSKIMNGDIILKNLENIQGDEADLVIVSVGYTKNASLSSTYVGRKGGRNALNVAITRAKSKMIVVKSISFQEIQTKSEMSEDLRTFKNWIEFLEMNEKQQKIYSIKECDSMQDIESNFEQEVYKWLSSQKFSKNMKVALQYPIGSYRIDLALLDANTDQYILGIEVDGLLYRSTTLQKYNDLVRQNFIEAKGYKLVRISELLWKTNKELIKKIIDESII